MAVAAHATLTDEQKEKVRKYGRECQKISHISDETFDKLDKGESTEGEPHMREQGLCFFKKIGFLNDDLDIQFDDIKTKAEDLSHLTNPDEAIIKCKEHLKGTNKEDDAFEFFKCFRTETKFLE